MSGQPVATCQATPDRYLSAIPHGCKLAADGTGECICTWSDEPVRLIETVPTGSYL